jgi:hypothetical protein
VNGRDIPFTVRFSRAVSLNDGDTRLELQAHSISGRDQAIPLNPGLRFYIFSCAGLFEAAVRREVTLSSIGSTGLRDGRVLLKPQEMTRVRIPRA